MSNEIKKRYFLQYCRHGRWQYWGGADPIHTGHSSYELAQQNRLDRFSGQHLEIPLSDTRIVCINYQEKVIDEHPENI